MRALVVAGALALAGCAMASRPATEPAPAPADAFMARLQALCGKAFAGRVVTTDPADADFAGKPLVMHVRQCAPGEVRIPFHVGDDRSRTWIVTRTPAGLRLKHDHRHADGRVDALTDYGGDTVGAGTAGAQAFPADAASIAMFRREGREAAVANVWHIGIDARRLTYALRRPGRHFEVAFDLTRPAPPPPPPWGS